MKHLFLEGDIQIGKSTLIRECLEPYKDRLGGFSSQRLREGEGPGGMVRGYRICPASDFSVDHPFDPDLPGIFMLHTESGVKRDPSVFADYGVALLEETGNADLILLDEIGGMELLVPAFRDLLYEILAGDIPCVGVIKSAARTGPEKGPIREANQKLREYLSGQCDAGILSVSPGKKLYEGDADEIRETIEKFLKAAVDDKNR